MILIFASFFLVEHGGGKTEGCASGILICRHVFTYSVNLTSAPWARKESSKRVVHFGLQIQLSAAGGAVRKQD